MQIDLGGRVESTPRKKRVQRLLWTLGIALAFLFYTAGLSQNPPGFYVDESDLLTMRTSFRARAWVNLEHAFRFTFRCSRRFLHTIPEPYTGLSFGACVSIRAAKHSRRANLQRVLGLRRLFVARVVSKAHLWPGRDRNHCGRHSAAYSLVL